MWNSGSCGIVVRFTVKAKYLLSLLPNDKRPSLGSTRCLSGVYESFYSGVYQVGRQADHALCFQRRGKE